MKLSELSQTLTAALVKYGDREVLVDVEARKFDYHLAAITRAHMTLTDESYEESPEDLNDEDFGKFIISID